MEDKTRQTTKHGTVESGPPNMLAFLGVLLLIFGAGTYFFNYESQTLETGNLNPEQTIIHYYAPQWDPFPHHVRIVADPSNTATFTVTIVTGESSEPETLFLSGGEDVIDVYPGETISIAVEGVNRADGMIKTVLWCDSWNYAAAILSGIGAILLITSLGIIRR